MPYRLPCGQTDTCENITFPQLRLWTVINCANLQIYFYGNLNRVLCRLTYLCHPIYIPSFYSFADHLVLEHFSSWIRRLRNKRQRRRKYVPILYHTTFHWEFSRGLSIALNKLLYVLWSRAFKMYVLIRPMGDRRKCQLMFLDLFLFFI